MVCPLSVDGPYLTYSHRLPKDPSLPPPLSLDDTKVSNLSHTRGDLVSLTCTQTTPLATASFFSHMSFSWVLEFMVLGYQRTLQAPDLYKLDVSRKVGPLAEKLEAAWTWRINIAAEWNDKLDRGEVHPSALRCLLWDIHAFGVIKTGNTGQVQTYKKQHMELEEHWRKVRGRKKASLTWALNNVFGWSFWLGGMFKVCAAVRCRMIVSMLIQIGD